MDSSIYVVMGEFESEDGVLEEAYPVEAFLGLQGALDYLADLAKEFSVKADKDSYSVYLPRTVNSRAATYYVESVEIS